MIKIVNVIIPIYKSKETLPKALDSLVAQTKSMFFVTLVQDCDDEDYSEIIKEYQFRGLHINLLRTAKNSGPGVARQLGIDKTICDYVMFMDSDDMLCPRAVEVLYREAKLNDLDIVSSDFFAEEKGSTGFLMSVTKVPVTWLHGKIYRVDYLKKNNIRFTDKLRLNEDAYFNLVAINCTDKKAKIKETTYIWRDNKNSLTRRKETESFFDRSWEHYILSQTMGLKSIYEIKKEISPGLFCATLINIYNHHMIALSLHKDDSQAKEFLKIIKQIPIIKDIVKSKEFWSHLLENLKGSVEFEDNIIFYRVRFCDWMKEYVTEELN